MEQGQFIKTKQAQRLVAGMKLAFYESAGR